MRTLGFLLLASLSAAWSQIPTASILPEIPDDAVLAIFDDGVKFTMREFRGLYTVMNPQMQQNALNNRKEWIQQYALFRKLALMAERDKLDKASPTKEALEFNRMLLLSQVKLNANMNATTVEGPEIVKAYETGRERFRQVKVKVIYVAFTPAALAKATDGKGLTEEQAKAKAERLVAEIRAGADFVKLVHANSDDQTSREKDGDFQTLRPTDNIPDAIRSAVFALKEGAVSDPVRQPNGFYILKAESMSYRPLSEVRDEIYNDLKMQHHKEWLERTQREAAVKPVNDSFFGNPPAPGGAAAGPGTLAK